MIEIIKEFYNLTVLTEHPTMLEIEQAYTKIGILLGRNYYEDKKLFIEEEDEFFAPTNIISFEKVKQRYG